MKTVSTLKSHYKHRGGQLTPPGARGPAECGGPGPTGAGAAEEAPGDRETEGPSKTSQNSFFEVWAAILSCWYTCCFFLSCFLFVLLFGGIYVFFADSSWFSHFLLTGRPEQRPGRAAAREDFERARGAHRTSAAGEATAVAGATAADDLWCWDGRRITRDAWLPWSKLKPGAKLQSC